MAQQATVLILADVGDAERGALETACAAAGFSPVVEASAEAATGKLTAKRFDALVVHLGTPGAALACMRARGKLLRARIPVIGLVETADEGAFSRAYRAGADEVLLLDRPEWLTARLRSLPRSVIPQPGNARGDAVVADADRTRAEVIERVLRDAGFRVEVAVDGFSTRLQAGRPSLKVAVVDASLDDVPSLIVQAKSKGARCAWVVRARPEQLDEFRQKLARADRVAVVSAYGPPEDVLFEVNRLIEPRAADGRAEARLLHGGILRLIWTSGEPDDIGYSYNISAAGLFVRTLVAPAGKKVAVDIAEPGGTREVHLECDVVWRREFGTTRKEPVPAGFALKIVGGDVVAWARVCPPMASLRPPANQSIPAAARTQSEAAPARTQSEAAPARTQSEAAPAGVPLIAAPSEVEIKPREQQSSVEEMLASVLMETIASDEAAGSAPLSIDGGTVVELHAAAGTPDGPSGEEVTIVGSVTEAPAPPGTSPYASERALTELLSGVSDATKTPLAIPRIPDRKDTKPSLIVPRMSDGRAGESKPPRVAGSESILPAIPRARDPLAETQRVSVKPSEKAATPPPSEPVPAPVPPSVKPGGPVHHEDGLDSVAEAVAPPSIRRTSDRPPPLDVSDITPASLGFDLSEDGRIIEAVRFLPPVVERGTEATTRVAASPTGASRPEPDTFSGEVSEVRPASRPPPRADAVPTPLGQAKAASARVVHDHDAIGTGDTMRPSAAGIPERPSPLPGLAAPRAPSFESSSAPRMAARNMPESDYPLPKTRSPLVWILLAVGIGGAAALFASPSLRKLSPSATSEPPPRPVATAPAPSVPGIQTASEQVLPREVASAAVVPAEKETASAALPAESAAAVATGAAAPEATASAAPPVAREAPAAPELDEAALHALEPGKGYLFVASTLATNVYVYGILAGTTNQRIETKCGPRFLRLGTEPGKWQGEGLVQIVKCGALTRVEMGK